MEVRLHKIFGEGFDDDAVVEVPTCIIGRERDCDLRLTCPTVSRTHCELIIHDDYVAVRDLNSKNGTWVNDEPVVSERQLFSGDNLRLGTYFFEVLIGPATGHSRRIEESSSVPLNDLAQVDGDAPLRCRRRSPLASRKRQLPAGLVQTKHSWGRCASLGRIQVRYQLGPARAGNCPPSFHPSLLRRSRPGAHGFTTHAVTDNCMFRDSTREMTKPYLKLRPGDTRPAGR